MLEEKVKAEGAVAVSALALVLVPSLATVGDLRRRSRPSLLRAAKRARSPQSCKSRVESSCSPPSLSGGLPYEQGSRKVRPILRPKCGGVENKCGVVSKPAHCPESAVTPTCLVVVESAAIPDDGTPYMPSVQVDPDPHLPPCPKCGRSTVAVLHGVRVRPGARCYTCKSCGHVFGECIDDASADDSHPTPRRNLSQT